MLETSHFNMGFFKHGMVAEMPPGYKFLPTDEELVTHYLTNKAFFKPLPAQVIQDIDATDLYSKPPMALVANACSERAWYFFIHLDQHFHGRREKVRVVGNGIGFWRSVGIEEPIYNCDGDVFASKICFYYFSGTPPKGKKTHWKMEEYRLPAQCSTNDLEIEEWVLGRIKRGTDYTSCY